jgi:DsbC/DsbD-like thiol-disulfide interchange protein
MSAIPRLPLARSAKYFAVRTLILAAFGPLAFLPAAAAQSPPPHARIELIADLTPPPGNARLHLGLLFHLDPGWHIYWQNAGDSGEPPKITWILPAGFIAGPIEWPTPKRLGSGSIIDYGYEDQVLLMAPIRAPMSFDYEARQNVQFVADVKYVVCREVCIPGKAHLALAVPISDAAQARAWHEQFEQTRQQLPKPAPAAWKISARVAQNNLVLTVAGAPPAKSATFFPQAASVIENSAPQLLATDRFGIHLTLKLSDQAIGQAAQLKGVLILDGARAYQITALVVSK